MQEIEKGWLDLLTELENSSGWQIVYVLGGSDSGKTMLCRFLVNHLMSRFLTAYVDCDPGQSVVGPPATLGMMIFFDRPDPRPTSYLRFLGSTSPRGHFMQTLGGIKRLAEKAQASGVQKVVIDSSGFVLGKPAQEFQFQGIDLLQPDDLIVLQRRNELETLLANSNWNKKIRIHRMPVSPAVRRRTAKERRDYRKMKFQQYFREGTLQELNFSSLGIHGRIPDLNDPKKCANLLIALCNQENFVITLGLIRSIDFAQKYLSFWSPPFNRSEVTFIQFGSIYLDITGQEWTGVNS